MEFVAVFIAIAALVWGAVLLLRGGIMAGCLATLLAGCCFGYNFVHFNIGPLPLTLDRLMICAMGGLYLIYRYKGWAEPKTMRKADILFGVMLFVLAVNTFTHNFQLNKFQPASRLLFLWVLPAVLYWVLRQSPLNERSAIMLFGFFSLFGVYLALTAYAETRGLWSFVFPKYIGNPKFEEFYGRGRGPFINPIANGIYLVTAGMATLMLWPRLPQRMRIPLLGIIGLIAMGTSFTYTRSIWMSFALCFTIVVGSAMPRSWRFPVIGVVALCGLILVATNFERLVAFKRDKNLTAAETADSVKLRPIFAAVAWRMVQASPLTGCGYGQYAKTVGEYVGDRTTPLMLARALEYEQHNVVFALVCETGLAGAIPFVLMLCFWAWDGWRLWSNKTLPLYARQIGLLLVTQVTVYGFNGMFHDVSTIPMVNILMFFMAGVSSGLAAMYNDARASSLLRRRTMPLEIGEPKFLVLRMPFITRSVSEGSLANASD